MKAIRRPLKDHVYEHIAHQIEAGALSAGDRVSEQAISDALGVSRTPVREALIELACDGYLDNIPRRGFRVRGFDRQSAREVFEIIGPLDGQAAFLACPHLEEEDFAQLRFLIDSMDAAIGRGLVSRYDDLQREFHHTYALRSENERLVGLLRQFERCFIKHGYETVDEPTGRALLQQANDEHRRILALLEARDAAGAREYIRDVHWSVENAPFTAW